MVLVRVTLRQNLANEAETVVFMEGDDLGRCLVEGAEINFGGVKSAAFCPL
jgi:hypothetical protein